MKKMVVVVVMVQEGELYDLLLFTSKDGRIMVP